MARPKPRLKQTRMLLNRLTLGLVSVLGFFSAASILTAPSTLAPNESSMDYSYASRGPASSVRSHESSSEKTRIQVLKLSCESEMEMEENSNQIRLRGKICSEKNVSIEKSLVKNSENEDVATVFHKEKDFTTDIIHLRPGLNKLVITNFLSDGSKNVQVLNVRRSPASAKNNN